MYNFRCAIVRERNINFAQLAETKLSPREPGGGATSELAVIRKYHSNYFPHTERILPHFRVKLSRDRIIFSANTVIERSSFNFSSVKRSLCNFILESPIFELEDEKTSLATERVFFLSSSCANARARRLTPSRYNGRGRYYNTSERRRLHNTCPLCRASDCWNPDRIWFPATLFCLSNEILREIWRPAAPAQELVNSIVRNRITRAVRLIFHSPTLPHRNFLPPLRVRDHLARLLLFSLLSLVRRRAPRPGTCRGSYARTRIFVITERVRQTRVSLYAAAEFLPRRVTWEENPVSTVYLYCYILCLNILTSPCASATSPPPHLCIIDIPIWYITILTYLHDIIISIFLRNDVKMHVSRSL